MIWKSPQMFNRVIFFVLLLLCASVYLAGLKTRVMEVDAAQYASISQEMMQNGSYLIVKHRMGEYLDKPPLLFWLSALSYKIFGVSDISYKLPSFLFSLLAIFSTFKLGSRLFGVPAGLLSAAILTTCQGFIFFNNDVRADTILTGAVIFSIWQLYLFLIDKKPWAFFLGFAAIGVAMLSKGPIGIMIPVLAFGSFFFWKKEYRILLKPFWIPGIALVGLVLSPMLWGLYKQYGIKGLDFYFWTQSFGRITGQNHWKDTSGPLFFTHTFLWSFLPWSIPAIYGVWDAILTLWKQKAERKKASEALLVGGSILPFIALSCSHYKLPHYIFVLFPVFSILTARGLLALFQKEKTLLPIVIRNIQIVFSVLIWVFTFFLITFSFPSHSIILWGLIGALCALTIYYSLPKFKLAERILLPSIVSILGLNLVLNFHFFPQLLRYQSGTTAASILNSRFPHHPVISYRINSHALDFNTHSIVEKITDPQKLESHLGCDTWIFTDEQGYKELGTISGIKMIDTIEIDKFHVTRMTPKFLFASSRKEALSKNYLVLSTLKPDPGNTLFPAQKFFDLKTKKL
jgi:4-amino-4-deoxy-L-arabinose transferase-like glycosyltransferase